MSRPSLNWSNITDDTCPDVAKEAFAEMAMAIDAFEEVFTNNAPKGKRPVFSYRKGNNGLSVGVALTDSRKTAGNLDWLPTSGNGHASR